MPSVLTKCRSCRRPFVKTADRCPDCGKRSAVGQRALFVQGASIAGAVIALIVAVVLIRKAPPQPASHQTMSILAPPTGGEVDFQ